MATSEGDLITGDWEAEYSGVLVGGDSVYGLTSVTGLLDLPDVRSQDFVLMRRDGLSQGEDWLGGREITMDFEIYGASQSEMGERVAAFNGAFSRQTEEIPLVFQFPGVAGGGKARVYARPRKREVAMEEGYVFGLTEAAVALYCTDPRIYLNTQESATCGLPSSGSGLTFNATFNASFGSGAVGGSMILNNSGNADAPVAFKLTGPATDATIENVTTGQTISISGTISGGTYYVFSSRYRTVLEGGTSDRYSFLATDSEWFDLAPGDNFIQFRADAYDAAASLVATWRSAYV